MASNREDDANTAAARVSISEEIERIGADKCPTQTNGLKGMKSLFLLNTVYVVHDYEDAHPYHSFGIEPGNEKGLRDNGTKSVAPYRHIASATALR